MNAYESGDQKIIPAVLLYAFHRDSVLMIHRNSNPQDFHAGKWNGLGGKLDVGETALQAASREFFEEAQCTVPESQWQWIGQLFFPNFKPHKKEDWWVNVLVTELSDEQLKSIPIAATETSSSEHVHTATPEGTLHLVRLQKVLTLNLWDGDLHFLPMVLKKKHFLGTFFYQNGKCEKFEISKLPNS